ncbi:MAG TPA: hypothetical protein VJC10_00610 [Patescibacteria group bacterium]|nr:hypothetical protein [Patescibacteria group bacterium]
MKIARLAPEARAPIQEVGKSSIGKEKRSVRERLEETGRKVGRVIHGLDTTEADIVAQVKESGVDITVERQRLVTLKARHDELTTQTRTALNTTEDSAFPVNVINLEERRAKKEGKPAVQSTPAKVEDQNDTPHASERNEREEQVDIFAATLHELWAKNFGQKLKAKGENTSVKSREKVFTSKRVDVVDTLFKDLPSDVRNQTRNFAKIVYGVVEEEGRRGDLRRLLGSDLDAQRYRRTVNEAILTKYLTYRQSLNGNARSMHRDQFYLWRLRNNMPTEKVPPPFLSAGYAVEAAVRLQQSNKKQESANKPPELVTEASLNPAAG